MFFTILAMKTDIKKQFSIDANELLTSSDMCEIAGGINSSADAHEDPATCSVCTLCVGCLIKAV